MKKYLFPVIVFLTLCSFSCFSSTDSPSSLVKSPKPDKEAVSFVAFGDQGTGGVFQQKVALQLTNFCKQHRCDFVVLLGDNFYFRGVKNVNDPLFKKAFEDPYKDLDLIFYPVLGNHDHLGNIQAQIDYSEKNPKWHMPHRRYSHAHPKDSKTPLVEFFVIDSEKFTKEDKAWFKEVFEASRATWKILYTHHPLISNGKHGDDSARIAKWLVPLICGKVDLILSGHDHSKEHLVGPLHGCELNQIVIGTGGGFLHKIPPDSRTRYAVKSFGFGWFQVNPTEIYFEFRNQRGILEYSTTVKH